MFHSPKFLRERAAVMKKIIYERQKQSLTIFNATNRISTSKNSWIASVEKIGMADNNRVSGRVNPVDRWL